MENWYNLFKTIKIGHPEEHLYGKKFKQTDGESDIL